MSKHIITDFKDLRDAIEEVRKSQPAQTQYEIQAEKMGYMQEAEAKPEDDKKDGFAKRDNHAGEEEIIKAYKSLGDKALAGSVEYRRKLLQKELAKMGYETYSKYAFDSIFKFEGNIQEIQLDKNMLMRDFPNVWATKDSKLYRILNTQIITYGFTTLLKSYKKDRKKFVDSLKKLAKSSAAQKRAGFGAKDMQYINNPKSGQSFHENVDVDLDEGKMSDLLIDIQQGATAKELARDFKIPLSVAKNFLKDYYGSKKGSRKESVKEAFNYSPKDFEAQVKAYKYKNGVKFSQVMKDFEDDWDSAFGNRGFDHDNVVDGLKKALKKARIRFKEDVDEGKLVAGISDIIDAVMKKIKSQVGKEIQKNQEKGLGMLNTLGSFVGAKVSDKKQEKGKLFLKWGDNISEDYGRGDQKGVAKIRGKSYFDSSVGDGWESALKDMLLGHITQREFERAFPALTKKDFETLLKSKEMKVRTQRWGVNDRDYKKKISQLMKGLKEGRNYKKEYENYHSKPEQIKRRAKRNEARRMLKNRKGIKGKDVHHKDNNPLNNDKSNLSIVSQKYNRTEPRLREKLGKDATIGDFIKDFKKSNAPQFKNQSAEEIKKMAVAAYYANQKRG